MIIYLQLYRNGNNSKFLFQWTFKRLKSFTYYNISVEACTVQCSEAAYLTSVLTNITGKKIIITDPKQTDNSMYFSRT